MTTKGGLIVKKQEMTRLRSGDKQVPVTLVVVPRQEVVRQKAANKDGYKAIVVWTDKRVNEKKKKGITTTYGYQCEFKVDDTLLEQYKAGSELNNELLTWVETVSVVGISKGKGFQGAMKRHHFAGGPRSHGSKFHRALGSTGNRNPKRTNKNQPMAGRMGGDKTTLKTVKVVDQFEIDGQQVVAIYGSIPGAYNSYLQLIVV